VVDESAAIKRLQLLSHSRWDPARLPLSTSAFFTHPAEYAGTANLGSYCLYRRPAGQMLAALIQNHSNRTGLNLR